MLIDFPISGNQKSQAIADMWQKGEDACPTAPVVTVIGGGITGLSVAHELVERGFNVQVVEAKRGQGDGTHGFNGDEAAVGGIAKTQWVGRPADTPTDRLPPEHHLIRETPASQGIDTKSEGSRTKLPVTLPIDSLRGESPRSIKPDIPDGHHLQVRVHLTLEQQIAWRDEIDEGTFDEGTCKDRTLIALASLRKMARSRMRVILEPTHADPRPLRRLTPFHPSEVPVGFVRLSVESNEPPLPGEHGYRFFPSFYHNLFDTMKRTPLYQLSPKTTSEPLELTESPYTAFDHLTPTTRMGLGIAEEDKAPLAVFQRRRPESVQEFLEVLDVMFKRLSFEPRDVIRYQYRLLKWMTACGDRREHWATPVEAPAGEPGQGRKGTWWEFVEGDRYSPGFQAQLRASSTALVAMRENEIDARTYGNVSVQLLLDQIAAGERTDMTLRGPTTTMWLVPWKRYLQRRGVRFFTGELKSLKLTSERERAPVWKDGDPVPDGVHGSTTQKEGEHPPYAWNRLDDGTDIEVPTAYVLALPLDEMFRLLGKAQSADAEETENHAQQGEGERSSTAPRPPIPALRGWWRDLSKPSQDDITKQGLFDPKETPDAPFRTFSGVQFFYDMDIPLHGGHLYFPNTPWGLSAIAQPQFWRARNGFGVISVDLGDFFEKDREGLMAKDANPNQLVLSTYQQMDAALGPNPDPDHLAGYPMPLPRFAHIDAYLRFEGDKPRLVRNEAPFLVNLPGQWHLRPGQTQEGAGRPDQDHRAAPAQDSRRRRRRARQRHIRMQPSFGRWWVAGPHTKTFTRMTTMEAANESARHVVNSLLLRIRSRRAANDDPNEPGTWGHGLTMGLPCRIWNPEENELPDLQPLKEIDELLYKGLEDSHSVTGGPVHPHMFEILGLDDLVDELTAAPDDDPSKALLSAIERITDRRLGGLTEALGRDQLPSMEQSMRQLRRLFRRLFPEDP